MDPRAGNFGRKDMDGPGFFLRRAARGGARATATVFIGRCCRRLMPVLGPKLRRQWKGGQTDKSQKAPKCQPARRWVTCWALLSGSQVTQLR
jgi:hypothetical protein